MTKEWILVVSIAVGTLVFIIMINKAKKQAMYHLQLPSLELVRQTVDDSFTGYILCMDYVRFASSWSSTNLVKHWMMERQHNFLSFDGAEIFPQALEIAKNLDVKYLPSLIAVKEGRMVEQGILLIPGDKDMLLRVEEYVGKTSKLLHSNWT